MAHHDLFAATSPLRSGDRIVFLGDSITQEGGYIRILRDRLDRERPDLDVELINRGVSGNKAPDLLVRLQRDVLDASPTGVVIFIGINDVRPWTSKTSSTREVFESALRAILAALSERAIPIVLATPSVIGERPRGDNPLDADLDDYAAISARLAHDAGATLCDLRAAFFAYLDTHNPSQLEKGVTTSDGVHMLGSGSRIIAGALAEALAQCLGARRDRV